MVNTGQLFDERFSRSMTRRLQIKNTIHSARTAYQQADVVDTHDYGVTLFLDGRFQTSEKDEYFYHESLVHPAMMMHPDPRRVLIIGGGDGGTLEEVTRYRNVERIRMVELDSEVVEIARKYLQGICGAAFNDPRLELIIGDGRKFVEDNAQAYDVILLDLTDPLEPSKYVYTREFYELCGCRLNPGGLLALHNDSPFFYPEAFNVISKTLEDVFPHRAQYLTFIPGYMLDFAFAVCSREPLPRPQTSELRQRMIQRRVGELLYYLPEWHNGLLNLPGYARKILQQPAAVSTDEHPYVLDEDEV